MQSVAADDAQTQCALSGDSPLLPPEPYCSLQVLNKQACAQLCCRLCASCSCACYATPSDPLEVCHGM
jgi:hypothetical protein